MKFIVIYTHFFRAFRAARISSRSRVLKTCENQAAKKLNPIDRLIFLQYILRTFPGILTFVRKFLKTY